MFGDRKLQRAREQREFLRARAENFEAEAKTAQYVANQIAIKFADGHTMGWAEVTRLSEQVDGCQNILARHARLLWACARYRAELRHLRAETGARLAAQEAIIERLQDLNERHYRELAERSGAGPAVPA